MTESPELSSYITRETFDKITGLRIWWCENWETCQGCEHCDEHDYMDKLESPKGCGCEVEILLEYSDNTKEIKEINQRDLAAILKKLDLFDSIDWSR